MLTSRRLRLTLLAMPIIVLALLLGGNIASAADPTPPDPSGIQTGKPEDLSGVTPGTLTPDDFTKAQQNEPFAYNLAALVNQNRLGINYTWTLVAGFLVMFMQLGFALVETGFCRAKNALHVMAMNFAIYFVGMLGYWICGFAFQFGGVAGFNGAQLGGVGALTNELTIRIGDVDWGLIGYKGFFLADGTYDVGIAVLFLFNVVFMDTTATIPTGAMAERWKWTSFVIYGFFVSTIIYPIFGNWAWGGGWLAQLGKVGLGNGYQDFAGSGVVHAVGGFVALAGAMVLGPRLGKYNRDGTVNTLAGHNLIFAIMGTLILSFGWFGFNPGSTLGASGGGNLRIGVIATNTMLAGAAGAMIAMLYMWVTTKKPDPGMFANGMLAGLVAITAPSGFVSPLSSVIIGGIAGVLVCVSVAVFDRVLKIDDPVGAISVHGVCGVFGVLCVGLFADGTAGYSTTTGLFFGNGSQLAAQAIGAVVVMVWSFGVAYVFFKVCDLIFKIRVPADQELAGLDLPEMGALAYQGLAEGEGVWPLPVGSPLRNQMPAGSPA